MRSIRCRWIVDALSFSFGFSTFVILSLLPCLLHKNILLLREQSSIFTFGSFESCRVCFVWREESSRMNLLWWTYKTWNFHREVSEVCLSLYIFRFHSYRNLMFAEATLSSELAWCWSHESLMIRCISSAWLSSSSSLHWNIKVVTHPLMMKCHCLLRIEIPSQNSESVGQKLHYRDSSFW